MSSGPYIYEKLAQLLDQDRNVSHAQGLSNGTSSVFCEILPGEEGQEDRGGITQASLKSMN